MAVHGVVERLTDLPVDPVSARQARRFVTEALASWSLDAVTDEAVLLTSEVVTNALLHTGTGQIQLRLVLLPDGVRIEIVDDSPTLPRPRHYSADAGTGRGLALVEAASRSWGARPTERGKVVWFEIAS